MDWPFSRIMLLALSSEERHHPCTVKPDQNHSEDQGTMTYYAKMSTFHCTMRFCIQDVIQEAVTWDVIQVADTQDVQDGTLL